MAENIGALILAIVAMVVGAAILFSPIFLLQRFATRMSRRSAASVARQLDLKFEQTIPREWLNQFAGIVPFDLGYEPTVWNVLQGEWEGYDLALFEHRYTIGHSAKTKKFIWQEMTILSNLEVDLPDLILVPALALDKFKSLFGKHAGISLGDSGTAKKFAKYYVLNGSDSDRLMRLFDSNVQEYFIKNRGQHLVVNAGRLISWFPDWRSEFGWCAPKAYLRYLSKSKVTAEALVAAEKKHLS